MLVIMSFEHTKVSQQWHIKSEVKSQYFLSFQTTVSHRNVWVISMWNNYSINHEINLFYIIILSIWILEIVSFVMIFESSHLLLRRHAIIYTKPKSNLFWFHIWSLPKECNGSSIQYKSHLRYQPWVIPSLV